MRFAFLSLSLTSLLATACPCLAADFESDAKAWADAHTENFAAAASLGEQGYPAAGNETLDALAEQDGSPVAAFVVGNYFYGSDPSASYRLHRKAQSALPHEPAIALAVARDQHRRGDYAAALANYRLPIATGMGAHYSALLADCLLHTGQLKAAVTAWKEADYAKHQADIELAICSVYGPLSPIQRRGDLIAKIEAGDLTKFTDLIRLDLSFDTDWWTAKVYDDGLEADLKRAAEVLGRKDARHLALAVYARLARPAVKKASDIQKGLKDAQLVIGPGAVLPADSQLARALCDLAVAANLANAAELWTNYEVTLRARLLNQDHHALRLLCWLAAANRNPALTELDQLGWEEWNDPEFAASYMVDLYREKKLATPRDSQLLAALAISPYNANLQNLRIILAGDDVTNDMIAGTLKAEFHKLSVGGTGRRDAATLNGLFEALGKRL